MGSMPTTNPIPFISKSWVNLAYPIFAFFYKRIFLLFWSIQNRIVVHEEIKNLNSGASVVSINTNHGGVPKYPISEDLLTPIGFFTDKQKAPYIAFWGGHGGYSKAVSVWS